MKALASLILALYLLKVVHSETATLTFDDGVKTITDGLTQTAKQVVITCLYEQLTSRSAKTQLELSTDGGNAWNTVVYAGTLQGSWDSEESYSATEVFSVEDTVETMTFTIKSTSQSDAGKYRCAVMNGETYLVEDQKDLTIYANTQSVELEGKEGDFYKVTADEDKLIECSAINGSMPEMRLRVDGKDIHTDETPDDSEDGVYKTDFRYRFSADQNNLRLTCSSLVPTYDGDDAVEEYATLQVTAKPVISCNPESQAKYEGSEAVFTCTVTGIPLPTENKIVWGWDTFQLAGTAENENEGVSSQVTVNSDNIQVVLTVTVLATNNEETYTLTVVNAGGPTYAIVELKKPGQKDQVGDGNGVERIHSFGLMLLFISTAIFLL